VNAARVLVTGATGLIGYELLLVIRSTFNDVHGVARHPGPGPNMHRADLAAPDQVAELLRRVRPSIIIHLAGGKDPDVTRLYTRNVLPTANLLHAAARLKPQPAFIVAGSAAEYGEPAAGHASEFDALYPITDYGRAKLSGSALAEALAANFGIRLCVVRPFNVVSPQLPQATALGNIRHQLLAQQGRLRVIRCGRLDVVRDFVPLSFVAEVLHRLLSLDTWPARLNVCSGVGIELGSILRAMCSILDVEAEVVETLELTSLRAATRVVGDPTLLHGLGLRAEPTPETLAQLMLSTGLHATV
jgi:nucleoside-diphosphate-sugar epimerase